MCQNGVNNEQLKSMISMANETIALSQEWLENTHHLADHAELSAATDLAQATVLLGEAREHLQKALDSIEKHGRSHTHVEVELV
ncbi:MAG: hypothetical protein JJE36_06565 [Coriobacteriia bacterium]|nr:hypothetical protein [Coriobacteriia bacterium]